MQGMKAGVDNIEKLALQAPNETNGGRVVALQDRKRLVWDVAGGIREILWVYRLEPNSWKRLELGPGFWILLLLAVPLYAALECIACMIWCRPVFASSMDGLGLYPDAPEMPFVIPTMLLKPLRPIWKPAIHVLNPFFGWLVRLLTYLATDGKRNDL
jgi:hypothetical protein